MVNSFPLATYRLQLNSAYRFIELKESVDYFQNLGISHLYSSPILKSKSGSTHGYDVTDPLQLNPEIGTIEDFNNLIKTLHSHNLGIIVDMVPNHMYIGNNENPWWNSILEKGEQSPFSYFFDIEWHPPKRIFDNKVFLPLLDQPFGKSLEDQILNVKYQEGKFTLFLRDRALPTDPKTWNLILEPLCHEMEKLPQEEESVAELKEIIRNLNRPQIYERIAHLFIRKPALYEMLLKQLEIFNGIKGHPLSFDLLEHFLDSQHYRLCYWRVANDEINYRRFFDILEYASIRIENEATFKSVHQLIFKLIKKGWINGLRIDHLDGLWDPKQYLENLYREAEGKSFYLIAEKILLGEERLRETWSLQGTVGYDFLNQLNGLFIYQPHEKKILDIYQRFTGIYKNIESIKYASKKLILKSSLAGELHLLTIRLNRIAEKHRYFQDFPFESLKKALREIIAWFPVYRTYIQSTIPAIDDEDYKIISHAVEMAQKANPNIDSSIFSFIENVLFFNYPDGVDVAYKTACRDFVMHFQQATGPVMAKGLEDTAFYRYFPLCSLNEVGADLGLFGITKENFHNKNISRFAQWPHTLLTTSTHDTKRSEDVRARINLLSEIPDEWNLKLQHWSQINAKYKTKIEGNSAPDFNEEYHFYQNLIGTCPLNGIDENYIKRIQKYMDKAIKEGKINSNWLYPNKGHDDAAQSFVQHVLQDQDFLESFVPFSKKISQLGMLNSLSQVVLKMTSPGIPDIYQGNEMWQFRFVDPDNRYPIDFKVQQERLKNLKSFEESLKTPEDGHIKLLVTQKLLQLRQKLEKVFNQGIYLVLKIEGLNEEHLIGYARIFQNQAVLIFSARFFTFFMKNFHEARPDFWSNTAIRLPPELQNLTFRNIFSQEIFPSDHLTPQKLFSQVPFSVLESF